MFRVRGGLKIGVLGLAVIGSHVSTAVGQPSVESRLEAIETQLNRLESKLDRVLAGQQMSVLGVGEEIIRQQACDGSMLDKQFFVICHMADWKIARWVGYHLTADKLQGTAKRTDNFRPDSQLPHDERSELSDYSGSGYDRGHMAPAAAFKRSKKAMSTTFFLSNMAPQTPQLNRRIWRILEEEVRTLAKEHGEVWVFTGNLFLDDTLHPTQPVTKIGAGRVAVPTHCFKAILLRTQQQDWQMFGFWMPNQHERIVGAVEDFLVPVDEIEEASGVDFFAFLPDALEEQLESKSLPWPVVN